MAGVRVRTLRRGSGLEGLKWPKAKTQMRKEWFAADTREWYGTSSVVGERTSPFGSLR